MNSAERREARYQRRKAARMKKKAAALREYGDFETVFSFERLYESYPVALGGKRAHNDTKPHRLPTSQRHKRN